MEHMGGGRRTLDCIQKAERSATTIGSFIGINDVNAHYGKMVMIPEKKQLKAKIEELSKEQNHHATIIEPLQEVALQTRIEVSASHSKVKEILELSTEKNADRISMQVLKEVLE